jgi:hypothetical protein
MAPNIKQYLNRTILVSIPHLFHDEKCRALTLLAVEATGLWLQSSELADKLLPEDWKSYASAGPVMFIPFAQIGGVLLLAGTAVPQAPPAASAPEPAARGAKSKAKGAAAPATKQGEGQ